MSFASYLCSKGIRSNLLENSRASLPTNYLGPGPLLVHCTGTVVLQVANLCKITLVRILLSCILVLLF